MGETHPRFDRWSFRLLLAIVSVAAISLLFASEWNVPPIADTAFWNALVAFAMLGIASDSAFLPLPRLVHAPVGSSVVFIPFLASVLLFAPPWPMVIAGTTGFVAHFIVRRKTLVRAAFNTAQYVLFVGLGGLVYTALGGHVGVDAVRVSFPAFAAMVVAFFVINQGTVALAVSSASDISIREAWTRIAAHTILYDLVSSSLAIVLAFLFIKLQIVGLVVLVLPLFFVRHMYQM